MPRLIAALMRIYRNAPRPSFQAVTLKLPCVMADPVKPKPLCNCLDEYVVFDLVGLNSLVAQRARLAGPESAPKARKRLAWQLSLCDALACDGPQFSFESREQQVGRAQNVLPVEYDGGAARRASFGVQLRAWTASGC